MLAGTRYDPQGFVNSGEGETMTEEVRHHEAKGRRFEPPLPRRLV